MRGKLLYRKKSLEKQVDIGFWDRSSREAKHDACMLTLMKSECGTGLDYITLQLLVGDCVRLQVTEEPISFVANSREYGSARQ